MPIRTPRDKPWLDEAALTLLRAALAAGLPPAAALAETCTDGPLAAIGRAVRLGQPLTSVAATVDTGDPGADLLVRGLALAERSGSGGLTAVRQVLDAAKARRQLTRLLAIRTAQARATARALTAIPLVVWVILVGFDRSALGFYATPLGIATGVAALVCLLLAHRWSRRLLDQAARAADRADPFAPCGEAHAARLATVALPAVTVTLLIAGVAAAFAVAVLAAAVAPRLLRSRPRAGAGRDSVAAGTGAGVVELLAVALEAGLPPEPATAAVAEIAPPAARPALAAASRRLRGGWAAEAAFADMPIADVGRVLAVSERWGTPAAPALRALADDLRDHARSAAEQAAERVQVALVFPTALLILPAFVLALVPPVLWNAFGAGRFSLF